MATRAACSITRWPSATAVKLCLQSHGQWIVPAVYVLIGVCTFVEPGVLTRGFDYGAAASLVEASGWVVRVSRRRWKS